MGAIGDQSGHDVRYVTCTEGGYEVLRHLLRNGIEVSEVVSLTPEQGAQHEVAGYYDVTTIAEEHDVPIFYPRTYEMSSDRDVEHFEDARPDLLIVNGWQRLIPEEVLACVSHGALGVHGSAFGLPAGRGRSPMNWSLIEDLDRFLLSVIRLDEGVDSGDIVGTRKYDINDYDDIRTLYYKLVVATNDILQESLGPLLRGELEPIKQDGKPTYYPKRTPEDGGIHWENPTRDIYNLVRAVTRPYPGAFTEASGTRVYIWEAQPFSYDFCYDVSPGTIVRVFETTGDFVVNTGDGTLLVTDWEAENWTPREEELFVSTGDRNRVDQPEERG